MKTLILLRHAKSGWDDAVARDFDRPLNAKGERAAETMGRKLRSMGSSVDLLVASPALRVKQTLEHFGTGFADTLAPEWDKRLYLAPVDTLLDVIGEFRREAASAMLVAHNPGLEELVLTLVRAGPNEPLRGAVEEKYPTASIAVIEFEVDGWEAVAPETGHLRAFVRPRDVDPALGPDRD